MNLHNFQVFSQHVLEITFVNDSSPVRPWRDIDVCGYHTSIR